MIHTKISFSTEGVAIVTLCGNDLIFGECPKDYGQVKALFIIVFGHSIGPTLQQFQSYENHWKIITLYRTPYRILLEYII